MRSLKVRVQRSALFPQPGNLTTAADVIMRDRLSPVLSIAGLTGEASPGRNGLPCSPSTKKLLKIFRSFVLVGRDATSQKHLADLRNTPFFALGDCLKLLLQFGIDPQT
jgi:hypothetical protein